MVTWPSLADQRTGPMIGLEQAHDPSQANQIFSWVGSMNDFFGVGEARVRQSRGQLRSVCLLAEACTN